MYGWCCVLVAFGPLVMLYLSRCKPWWLVVRQPSRVASCHLSFGVLLRKRDGYCCRALRRNDYSTTRTTCSTHTLRQVTSRHLRERTTRTGRARWGERVYKERVDEASLQLRPPCRVTPPPPRLVCHHLPSLPPRASRQWCLCRDDRRPSVDSCRPLQRRLKQS